ncbi:MAG: DUF349 domain-containing protein [Lentimicrobium sp.]|nr:DUF349 domain-containing protein [Lentimicrobium sp.]
METKPQSDQNPDEVINDQDLNAVSAEVEAEITENETHEPVMEEQEKELTGSEITSEDELPSGEAPSAETPEITNTETPDTVVLAEAEVKAEVVAETEAEVNTEAETEERLPAPAETETPAETEAPAVTETLAETEAPAEVLQETSMEASPAPDPEVVPEVSEKEPVAVLPDESSDDDEQDDSEEGPEGEDAGQPGELEGMTREELVVRLEELVKQDDVNKIKGEVSQIKVAFLKLNKEFKHEAYQKLAAAAAEIEGDNESEESPVIPDDEIEERFKAAFQIYKQNKGKYNEQQEKIKIQNLEAKNHILEELKVLISSEETLKKTYDEFKVLQERWKAIGMVPKTEINTLWQNYHFLVEKFFDKVKINKELKDLDLKKNLEAKIHLCEKAEELLLESSIIKSFKQLQQYHEEWKEIGPVPQDKKDELWERFRSATDKINERRREYYNQMQEGLEQNFAAKNILCEKAEQVISTEPDSIKGWQDSTNQITELLQVWKTIGPAPKKQNNEIWARFKGSLDAFFNAKKEFYNKLKEQQMHNYNLKIDLCVQAEALRSNTDWRNTTRELINLQNEWKKIGPVPRKQSDRIWKRFRAACDEFFASKSEYFKNVSGHEEENLKLKLELIEKVKVFEIGDNRNEAVETLKDFQRQWMEIGHVPIKEKEKLQTEFRTLINKHFEKLKMESISMGALNYKSRIERMAKDAPDAGRVISKERNFVQGKIQQLQEDIKLWENNIGFFANSKTANLLKQEFEKKIEKAREELQMLETKLKMLREANQ